MPVSLDLNSPDPVGSVSALKDIPELEEIQAILDSPDSKGKIFKVELAPDTKLYRPVKSVCGALGRAIQKAAKRRGVSVMVFVRQGIVRFLVK